MDSLRDRVYPVTRRINTSECNVTFERYCNITIVIGIGKTCIVYISDFEHLRSTYKTDREWYKELKFSELKFLGMIQEWRFCYT